MTEEFETVNLICPHCGQSSRVQIPLNQCVLTHTCTHCGAVLQRQGNSCVYCTYDAPPSSCATGCACN